MEVVKVTRKTTHGKILHLSLPHGTILRQKGAKQEQSIYFGMLQNL